MTPAEFITQWGAPGGVPDPAYALNEEQGAQNHFLDLCDLLGVAKPGSADSYLFEERSTVIGGKTGYADGSCAVCSPGKTRRPGKTWTPRSSNS